MLRSAISKPRREALSAMIAATQIVIQTADDGGLDAEAAPLFALAQSELNDIMRYLEEPVPTGRGISLLPRLPTIKLPKSPLYDTCVQVDELFKDQCGWTPTEFNDLLDDVRDVLLKARDPFDEYGPAANAMRRRRAYKYRPEERLFFLLCFLRQYRSFRKTGGVQSLSHTALWLDVYWLRKELVKHEKLVKEVKWPNQAERQRQRDLLKTAGLLTAGFEDVVAAFDSSKDPSKRGCSWSEQALDYNEHKGHGKIAMLGVDPFGKPIYLDAGLMGNQNDRGLWKLTDIYNEPGKYITPAENFLMDGVFQGNVTRGTTRGAILPADRADIAQARAIGPRKEKQLREYNRKQRYLRVVVEQTFGLIKQYKIVGDIPYRGDLEMQGTNFLLCTQLTARAMRVRDSYPRGQKFLRGDGLEKWEEAMGNSLYVDPAAPWLY